MNTPRAKPRSSRAGFTLLTMVLLLALAAISAAVVLNSVSNDSELRGLERRASEAREVAEGGLMEVLNDQRLSSMLPDPSTPLLHQSYTPSAASLYNSPSVHHGARSYTAGIDLVRVAPMMESSHSVVRAVLYQVQVRGQAGDGTQAGLEAEIYKVGSARSGVIQPRTHAR